MKNQATPSRENRPEGFKAAVCTAAAIMLLCLSSCEEKEARFDEIPKPVNWMKVTAVDSTETRILSGVLQPADLADLSFEIPGRIEEIRVKLGDIVAAGDTLAVLEKKTFLLNVRQREAQLLEAEARLVQAESDYQRKMNLLESGAVSELQFESSKSLYESTLNQVRTLKAQLDIARENLADTSITAPYPGRISNRYMEPAQQVQPGVPVLRIHNFEDMEVSVSIPETFVQDLEPGQMHTVGFPAYPDLEIKAELTELAAQANTAGSFPAVLKLEEAPERLKAGMTAQVTFFLKKNRIPEEGDVFDIPLTAVVPGDGDDFHVFLFNKETETAEKTSIRQNTLSRNTARVTFGLKEGDLLITHGASFLHDGQKIRLIDSAPGLYQD